MKDSLFVIGFNLALHVTLVKDGLSQRHLGLHVQMVELRRLFLGPSDGPAKEFLIVLHRITFFD